MVLNVGGVSMSTFATKKKQRILVTNNRGTMLLKTFIHQEYHVIEYGIKKLQMGSNLEPHKKKKTN
jgi:hypothetical protein